MEPDIKVVEVQACPDVTPNEKRELLVREDEAKRRLDALDNIANLLQRRHNVKHPR